MNGPPGINTLFFSLILNSFKESVERSSIFVEKSYIVPHKSHLKWP